MIIYDVDTRYDFSSRPWKRVREEIKGGQVFDPVSGNVSFLDEEGLARACVEAQDSPHVVYYASRQWSGQQLSSGCSSSPNRIYLEVTQRCNLACVMCYREAGQPAPYEFGTDAMIELIRKLAMIGVHELRFTGGEPTTRDDILVLLDQAIDVGLYVSFGTNGVWPDDLVGPILERPIGRFLVSLEGIQSVNDALRGKGSFERTLRTVDLLVETGKSIRINTILSQSTLKHLPELVALCVDHRVNRLSLITPRPLGRASDPFIHYEMPKHTEMEAAARMIKPIHKKYGVRIEFQYDLYHHQSIGQGSDPVINKVTSCPAGRESAFISPDGWLYACGCSPGWSSDLEKRAPFSAGNVVGLTAKDIWQMWQLSNVWKPFRDLGASKDPICFKCPHYGNGCFGSCPVHAFMSHGAFNAPDPMCWVRDKIAVHSREVRL